MDTTRKKKALRILCIGIILCIISSIGACLVQSDFGKVTIKDLRFETASGHTMSALLLVPDSATAENPAPAIVCSHGWYNNREMQDLNYVEYARRGFVVLSIDMYGHGNSDDLASGDWWKPENNANGMYDAVKMMATLPFVDNTRIGVTGHSNGALASRTACLLDNEADTQLIAAALLVSNDAVYVDGDGNYANLFGSRDMGIVACQYDEFFHRVKQEDGSRSAPRDYINQATAQSFLHFGQDPAGQDTRAGYTYYTEDVDGQETIRVIFNAEMTHPWAHFSKNVVASSVEFFDKALGAPNMLAPNNQIWQVKAAFNALGLVGFVTFAVGLALTLLMAIGRKTVRTADDLKRSTSVPCMGTIPAIQVKRRRKAAGSGVSILNPHLGDTLSVPIGALQVRLLRSQPAGGTGRIILITSTMPGEGKTTVSFNLAASLAQSGKRVILVDADLRHQVVKARFGITTPSAGLLELSRAAKPDIARVLIPVPGVANLSLLAGDTRMTSPMGILDSPKMRSLLERTRTLADYVIIDAPPAGLLADAAVLCRSADQVLYVVRYDSFARNQVADAMHSVSGRGAELTGYVINGRPTRRGRGYGYGYDRYGYGKYGYGTKYGYGKNGSRKQDDAHRSSGDLGRG